MFDQYSLLTLPKVSSELNEGPKKVGWPMCCGIAVTTLKRFGRQAAWKESKKGAL